MKSTLMFGSIFCGLILFFVGSVYTSHPIARTALYGPTTTQMLIDIRPRDFPNSINPRSTEVIPVAILTNHDFDAHTVDPHSVRFGKQGTEAPAVQFAIVDVDGDGTLDFLLHFRIQYTQIHCGDKSASFTARTTCGQAITSSYPCLPSE